MQHQVLLIQVRRQCVLHSTAQASVHMPHFFALVQDTAACQHNVTVASQEHVQKNVCTDADLDAYSSLCLLLLTFLPVVQSRSFASRSFRSYFEGNVRHGSAWQHLLDGTA